MIVKTKQQAISYRDDQIRTSYDREMLNAIYLFLIDIGASRDIPESEGPRKAFIQRVHESLSVNNPFYPEDIPFHVVYPRFFSVVINNQVERRGNNISALVGAFKNWISNPRVTEELYETWYRIEPSAAPKQLQSAVPGETPDEIETNRIIEGQPVEKWPDSVLKEQLQTIQRIFGQLEEVMPSTSGYRKQVIQEAKNRGLV